MRREFEIKILQTFPVSVGHTESQTALHCHHDANQRGLLEKVIRTAQAREGKEVVGPCPPPRGLQL